MSLPVLIGIATPSVYVGHLFGFEAECLIISSSARRSLWCITQLPHLRT
jgi:hypothetical protein